MADEKKDVLSAEESGQIHEDLRKGPQDEKLSPDEVRRAQSIINEAGGIISEMDRLEKVERTEPKGGFRVSVDISAVAKQIEAAMRELEEKGDCCLLSLQAMMLGTEIVTFKFQCPHSVNLFAVKLVYCPKCGKKL